MSKTYTTAVTAKNVKAVPAPSFETPAMLMMAGITRTMKMIVMRHMGFFFLKQTSIVCKETSSMFEKRIPHLI
jgi:hypothetical protein